MSAQQIARELDEITKKAEQIFAKGKSMTLADRDEIDRLTNRGLEIKSELYEAHLADDLDTLKDFVTRPAPKFPLPSNFNGGSDGAKALSRLGWESKARILHAPTSLGLVPMFHESTLFGAIPTDDPIAAAYFKQTRAAMQPEYKAAYAKHLLSSVRLGDSVMAFTQLEPLEQKALSEGQDTAGGFLVPPDYQAEILVRLGAYAVVRKAGATVQPTSRDTLRYPMVQAAAATEGGLSAGGDSIFAGGFVGSWVGEMPTFTDKDAVFGLFQVLVKKIRAVTRLSNDFIADSAVDVIAWLARNGAANLALVEDYGFLSGDGAALKPKGILNNGATGVDIGGTTARAISNTTANVGSAPKLVSFWQALPPQYDVNAVFVGSKGSEGAIRKLTDAQGRFLWPAMGASSFAAPGAQSMGAGGASSVVASREFQGRPVLNSQFLADGSVAMTGAANQPVMIYGDFSAYVIAQRAQITTIVLRERFADVDQTGVILFERVGGDSYNVDAFRFGTL
jgi:HK97 family phage major capsid protein